MSIFKKGNVAPQKGQVSCYTPTSP